jgi:hypothetical protein|tara:strand:- start:196 stop:561 length:366 start_codon:yes stop_codon:yes gene_type:complete
MKILTTSASEQNINVIPRLFLSTYTLKVHDEAANTQVFNGSVNATDVTNYRRIAVTFSPVLKEGRFYTMTLLSGSTIVYKDKIFCTDQTINQANNDYYDINSGQYDYDDTSGSHDNDYIIL